MVWFYGIYNTGGAGAFVESVSRSDGGDNQSEGFGDTMRRRENRQNLNARTRGGKDAR